MTLKEFETQNPTRLVKADILVAAKTIGCEPAALEAVSMIEAPNGGFIAAPDNRPVILFESHTFHTQTGGKYDQTHPNISTNAWVHNYGASGSHQYDRLYEAISLNRDAALKAASWAKYQIMGLNFYNAGYDTVEQFVADMVESEAYQLEAFIAFLQNEAIDQYLINKDWSGFALHYNGSGQVAFYAGRMAQGYHLAVQQGWNNP